MALFFLIKTGRSLVLPKQTEEQLFKMAQEVSEREGCHLYDIEFVGRGKERTLRVYIDTLDHRVTIDQCANVSRGLSLLLDVEDLIPGDSYHLEVSSPGLERPLKRWWHFQEVQGEMVSVKTLSPIPVPEGLKSKFKNPRQQIKGTLASVDEAKKTLKIVCDGETWDVPFQIIRAAKKLYQFDEASNKKKKR
ncbi:MAG: ribosome maturation factor RimP [Bdellovibrio sp.]|nr:MAG: ribosome maturation factor RimP [Bdellovibrio sp.]